MMKTSLHVLVPPRALNPDIQDPGTSALIDVLTIVTKLLFTDFVYIINFVDSPISLTYKDIHSVIVTPLHEPVQISLAVLAYPVNVSFQWYFKPDESEWMLINSTDDRFSAKTSGLLSVLTVRKFEFNLQGNYRVSVWNRIADKKMFSFKLHPEGQ